MKTSRRDFLRTATLLFGGGMVMQVQQKQGADPLPNPELIGRRREALQPLDNDPTLVALERKLKCPCPCTLDVYTCRTTDFTCTFSPEMHREIRGRFENGQTPEEIIDFFVGRDGMKVLMAPPAQGFNLAGYLVPGLSVATAALVLAAYLSRKRQASAPSVRLAKDSTPLPPSAEDHERLRRALDDVES